MNLQVKGSPCEGYLTVSQIETLNLNKMSMVCYASQNSVLDDQQCSLN